MNNFFCFLYISQKNYKGEFSGMHFGEYQESLFIHTVLYTIKNYKGKLRAAI